MDSSRKSTTRKNEQDKKREEEEKDQQQVSPPKSNPKPRGDAVFGRIGVDDAPDKLQFRSMTAVAPPLSFGMNAIGGRPLMHMPAPMGLRGKAKNVEAVPFSTTRVDRTNYVNLTPRDLPPPPFRLELHTHFHVKGEAIQRVCSVVGIKLSQLDTDFTFKSDKCKWKVDYRRDGSGIQRVNMNILIFKSNKEYIVEVQRREGDIMSLMHLYSELKQAFKSQQLLCEKEKSITGLKRPASRPLPKMPLSIANVSDAVSAIRGLLENRFVDAQMQGVLGAISLSTRDETRSSMSTLVPQLVALGHSKNTNVSKLVRVALARLCDHPECRQAFIESEGWEFIVKCAAGGSDVTAEVQRESLHVVECLCPIYSDELAKVEGATQVLELVQGWENIEDPRLKKHAYNAQRALREAGVIA